MACTSSEKLLSDTISWLRFPLMVGIVYLHHNVTEGVQKHGMVLVDAAPSWLAAFIAFFSDALARVAIPLFFIISGFLFFYYCDFNKSTYIDKLKRRTSSLLLPYITWNVIATILALVALLPFGTKQVLSDQSIGISDLNYTISGFFYQFWDVTKGLFLSPYSGIDGIFPANGVLWYVRDLLILIVFSPVIYWLLKRAGHFFVYALGLTWVILEPVNLGHTSQLLSGLFFFSWGG